MTELIEPTGALSPEIGRLLLQKLAAALPDAAGIAVVGTRPPGLGSEFCAGIARLAEEARIPLLIDTFSEIAPLLEANCDKYLKINAEELLALTGIEAVPAALNLLADCHPRLTVAVTGGSGEAYLIHDKILSRFRPPQVATVASPLGCGDTASAVFFIGLLNGLPPEEAFRRALAAASANCLTPRAGCFRQEEFENLLPQVRRV